MAEKPKTAAQPPRAANAQIQGALDLWKSRALEYPEAWEDHPWGEYAIKVRKKVFVFLSTHKGGLTITVKLPQSGEEALLLPFTEPTGYGLGKSGWVSANWEPDVSIPTGLVLPWIDESYRCIAPKALVKQLPANGS